MGTMYRYEDCSFEEIELKEFIVVKETPCGKWVVRRGIIESSRNKKWVSNTSTKKLCHDTKAEALESYIYRKNFQIEVLKSKVDYAETNKAIAVNLLQELHRKMEEL